jgi:hypothetical protein
MRRFEVSFGRGYIGKLKRVYEAGSNPDGKQIEHVVEWDPSTFMEELPNRMC